MNRNKHLLKIINKAIREIENSNKDIKDFQRTVYSDGEEHISFSYVSDRK